VKSTVRIVLLVALGAVRPVGADGTLDPSFGNGGLVTTTFLGGDSAASIVMLPDGRAVVAGYTSPNLAFTLMAVARYLPSGALDTTFDGDGRVTVLFPHPPPGFESYAEAATVLLQPDGRLVLVGNYGIFQGSGFALARLNGDGSLDPSFGTGGLVTTPNSALAAAGLLQPDGRIVAVGRAGSFSIAAARYNADGSLDPSFGTGGQVIVSLPQGFDVGGAALQPDGKVVIVGAYPSSPFVQRDFALFRLLPGGAPDPSFGANGLVTSDFGQIETGRSVIVLGDGRLVVAGWRSPTTADTGDFALVRYMADGTLDTTFGSGGLATADSGVPDLPNQLIRLPNGKLLVAGSTNLVGAPEDFLLARFLPDGALDTSFGVGGFLRKDFNAGQDEIHAVAIAGPDLILAAGSTPESPPAFGLDFALARYIATTPVELLVFEVE
jgi:uncharacterized delta-60 repeat protein